MIPSFFPPKTNWSCIFHYKSQMMYKQTNQLLLFSPHTPATQKINRTLKGFWKKKCYPPIASSWKTPSPDMGVSKNSGFSPKSSILIWFSIIFTIHFGVPLFLETPICLKTKDLLTQKPQVTKVQKIQIRLQRSIEGVVHAQGPNFQTQVIPFWRHLKGGLVTPKKRDIPPWFLCSNSPLKGNELKMFFCWRKKSWTKSTFWNNFVLKSAGY